MRLNIERPTLQQTLIYFLRLLAAGLDGIKKKMPLPNPIEANVYKMTDSE
ncbi:MAG: hypothetical protein CM1200mP39_18430 [Dehalococcoidia bacterium]|nr:MAG: hypothetical protein CM1200mP39_18430 [Dehalococcoidia bacterium]